MSMEEDLRQIEDKIETIVAQIPKFTANGKITLPSAVSELEWSIHIPNALLKLLNLRLVCLC